MNSENPETERPPGKGPDLRQDEVTPNFKAHSPKDNENAFNELKYSEKLAGYMLGESENEESAESQKESGLHELPGPLKHVPPYTKGRLETRKVNPVKHFEHLSAQCRETCER